MYAEQERRKMTMSRRDEKKGRRSLVPAGVEEGFGGLLWGEKWRTVLQYRREQEGKSTEKWGRKGRRWGRKLGKRLLKEFVV